MAILEGPYEYKSNRAYIVNCDGSLRATVDPTEPICDAMFYDVIYLNGELVFLAAVSNRDIRVRVDETNGAILQVVESRQAESR